MTFDQVCNIAAAELAIGWELRIVLEFHGYAIELVGPTREAVALDVEDETLEEQVLVAVQRSLEPYP